MSDDGCMDYDGVERRKHCELIIMLKTQFDEDRKSRDEFRNYVYASLKELKNSIKPLDEINTSYTRGKWIVGIASVAMVGAIVTAVVKWVGRHWN